MEPGGHSLRLRKGRYSSRTRTFDAAEGAVVEFLCHGARIWPTYVASLFVRSLAISLQPS